MSPTTLLLVGFTILLSADSLVSQTKRNHTSWSLLTKSVEAKAGEIERIKLQVAIVPGAHLYSDKVFPPPIWANTPTEVVVGEKTLWRNAGPLIPSKKPRILYDEGYSYGQDSVFVEYWEGVVELAVPVKISSNVAPGLHKGWVLVTFMTCEDGNCRQPTEQFFEIEVVVVE